MKKMKLSFKIMSALFIFVAVGITGCTKNQLGIDKNEKQTIQKEISADEMINQLTEAGKIISAEENYTDEESGYTGTLYTYMTKGGEKQFLKVENFKNSDKGIKKKVTMWVDEDINVVDVTCEGPGAECIGFRHIFVVVV